MGAIDKAQRVAELTNTGAAIDNLIKIFVADIERVTAGHPEESVQRVVDVVRSTFESHKEQMIQIMVTGFVRNFTDEELDAMITFYDSDVGRSILGKQHTVLDEAYREINLYQSLVVFPHVKEEADRVLAELEKEALAAEFKTGTVPEIMEEKNE